MSEYTLIRDITSYTYPSHMKRPEGFFGSNFFEKWIPKWQTHLGHLSGKPDVIGIEIGCLHGDCTVFCAEKIANGENSLHCAIDINDNEYFTHNIQPYDNIRFIKGNSYDILHNFTHNGQMKEFADYIYIDGDHRAMHVLNDIIFSWYLLKNGGLMCLDDYLWGIHTTDELQKPKLAIDTFLNLYKGHYEIIEMGWQVWIKKISPIYTKEELDANYQ